MPSTVPPAPTAAGPAAGPARGGRHRRDRLTLSLYAYFVTWGWLLYSFSPAVPLLAAEARISKAEAGLHGTAMALGTVASALCSARLAARLGRRGTLLASAAAIAVGVAVLVLGPSTPATLTGAFVTAVGGGLAISAAQPALAVHHGEASASVMAEANGVGALVGLVAPLALGASVAAGFGWRPAVAATVGLAVLAALLTTRLPAHGALGRPEPVTVDLRGTAGDGAGHATGTRATGDAPGAPVGRARFGRAYWLFWCSLLAAVAVENATTFWVADLVADRTGAGPGIATGALAGLVGAMAVMRFTLARLLRRWTPETLLVAAFGLAAVGWFVTWSATSTVVALGGLVVAGLGYGAQYPLAIALVLRASAGRPDQGQAGSTLGVGLAVGIAPFLLGALADRLGTHTAFVVVPVMMAVGATAVLLGRRSEAGGAPSAGRA